jgi:hypothetical protein
MSLDEANAVVEDRRQGIVAGKQVNYPWRVTDNPEQVKVLVCDEVVRMEEAIAGPGAGASGR